MMPTAPSANLVVGHRPFAVVSGQTEANERRGSPFAYVRQELQPGKFVNPLNAITYEDKLGLSKRPA
jgi:hypothetical protein